MKKKLLALLLVVATVLVMAGCVSATVTTDLSVTSAEGAGTKTISFKIHKDDDTLCEEVTEEDGSITKNYTFYNNSTYFPKGYAAFMDWYISTLPSEGGFTYTIDEDSDPDYLFINFSYSFTTYADYAKKTRMLVGEERWTKCAFVDPQLIIYKVEDPLDDHYGMLAAVYVESNFITQACLCTMYENAISQAAIDAGVLNPYGDVGDNEDCKECYDENHGINEDTNKDETFKEYADVQWRLVPSNAGDVNGDATYIFPVFGETEGYTETQSADAMRLFYVADDGTYTVTDVTPFLPEGKTEGKFYCDGKALYVLTPKTEETAEETEEPAEEAEEAAEETAEEPAEETEEAAWLDGFDMKKITLGKKPTDRTDPEEGVEFGTLTGKNVGGSFPWKIVAIIGGVVVVAAAVVVVAIVLKKKNEEDDDEDDDDDEEETEEEEQ